MHSGGRTFSSQDPEGFAEKAAAAGFGHVSLQWDDVANRPYAARLGAALRSRGLTFGVWESEPYPGSGAQAIRDSGAEHYIAQAEAFKPWPEIVQDFRSQFPLLPAAVVTTFWGLGATMDGYDPEVCKPVIDAGFHCITEAYVNQSSPTVSPERLHGLGRALGWPNTQPAIGVYWDFPAKTYIDTYKLADFPGYWAWLPETMTQEDWQVLADFNHR